MNGPEEKQLQQVARNYARTLTLPGDWTTDERYALLVGFMHGFVRRGRIEAAETQAEFTPVDQQEFVEIQRLARVHGRSLWTTDDDTPRAVAGGDTNGT